MPVEPSGRRLLADHFAVPVTQVSVAKGGSTPAYTLEKGRKRLFIKLLHDDSAARAEADGLRALSCGGFRVPAVEEIRALEGAVALVLEWLPLAPLLPAHRPALVAALQALHAQGAGQAYGWARDNRIGPALQYNERDADWARFFARQRLLPQLSRARGLPAALRDALSEVVARCARLLPHQPTPALLHGDLWHGNLAWCEGQPALFDPAVYVGDAEADLAMLMLFGEPVDGLVAACRSNRADPDQWPLRGRVYDLYHLLNHYNLFGSGWLPSLTACCTAIIEESHPPHEGGR